jgi:MerR family transcriptional regulator, copper efflux regulator
MDDFTRFCNVNLSWAPKNMNLKEFLTVKQTAELLGVCPETLRNWDRTNKLKAFRHPINGYRLYRRDELEGLMGVTSKEG